MDFKAQLEILEKDYNSIQRDLQSTRRMLDHVLKRVFELYQFASISKVELPPSRVVPNIYGYGTTRNTILACLSEAPVSKTSDLIARVKECRPGTMKQSVYVLLGRMKEEGVIESPAHGYWKLPNAANAFI